MPGCQRNNVCEKGKSKHTIWGWWLLIHLSIYCDFCAWFSIGFTLLNNSTLEMIKTLTWRSFRRFEQESHGPFQPFQPQVAASHHSMDAMMSSGTSRLWEPATTRMVGHESPTNVTKVCQDQAPKMENTAISKSKSWRCQWESTLLSFWGWRDVPFWGRLCGILPVLNRFVLKTLEAWKYMCCTRMSENEVDLPTSSML